MQKILIDYNFADFTEEKLLHNIDLLPDWRKEQALRFKHFEGRRNCTVALLLLAECLGVKPADIPPFQYNEHGKPSLMGQEARDKGQESRGNSQFSILSSQFSISHCHEAVACMVSDMPCGIDVESVGRYRDSVARYSMDEEQMQHILSSDDPALAFIRLWTQKEAYLKALGTGIQDNMRDIPSSLLRRVTHTEVHSDKGYVLSWCVLENAHKPH